MTQQDLIDRLTGLAEEAESDHPRVAAMLLNITGSLAGGLIDLHALHDYRFARWALAEVNRMIALESN